MNSDFEKKLGGQPMRELPPEWRSSILRAASPTVPNPKPTLFSAIYAGISGLLWPHPRAWGALAAVWVAVLLVNYSLQDTKPASVAKNVSRQDWIATLLEQRRLMAELTRNHERAEIDRPQITPPSPRSHLRKEEELAFV